MEKKIIDPERQLAYLHYVNRENSFHHHFYEEDMKQFVLMQAGDPAAVEESSRMMVDNQKSRLSEDPVENIKFLFVACAALTSRFAVDGGMDSESAYTASDMYIRKLAACRSVEEVLQLHREMMTFYTSHMASMKKDRVFSKPVIQCMDYIDSHLHVPVRIQELAELVDLNPNYLSTLFHQETGTAVSDYIRRRKIDTAKNMLRFSDYSLSYISEVLAFCSQSHFNRVFRKLEGMTPKEYRELHFRDGIGQNIPQEL